MRVLVTGGAGFIGSCYVRCALAGAYPALTDAEIVVLDKLTYAGTLTNLDGVLADERLRFVEADICDPVAVREAMSGVDEVVHLAAESHVDRSILGASAFVLTNVLGTQVMLDAALEAGVSSFVHVSTDEVYGSIAGGSWREDQPLAPNSPYAASKAAGDLLALAYHRTHGLPVVVTRGSNTYGPHQLPEKVVPLFVTTLLEAGTVPLYGDGRNVREWTHVEDHCRGIELARTRGRPGQVYHLGGGPALTNRELTARLLAACGADWSSVRHVADRKGHDLRYSVDIGKARAELGYEPQIPIDEGLAATVDWYREHRAWWEPLRERARLGPG